LGRGSGIYKEPRKLLRRVAKIIPIMQEKENALCCGGSLGDLSMDSGERRMIRDAALETLLTPSPDMLITACPLCKKTFRDGSGVEVKDIAELVADQLEPANAIQHENHGMFVR